METEIKFENGRSYPFEAFITNLGKYSEGNLVGEWLEFPTTHEKLQELLKRIGIGSRDKFGDTYEECFITDYNCNVDGLYGILGEHENLDELNYFASKLQEMDNGEYEHFKAAIRASDYVYNLKDLINLTDNLDKYEVYQGITDNEKLGQYCIENYPEHIPDSIIAYIDYEAVGRDQSINDGGIYTEYGYVVDNQSSFTESYDGILENIPKQYQIEKPEKESVQMESERVDRRMRKSR